MNYVLWFYEWTVWLAAFRLWICSASFPWHFCFHSTFNICIVYHFVFSFTFLRRTWMKIIMFNGVLFLHWASHKRHVIFKLKQIKSIIHIYISSAWERKEGKQMCASENTHKHTWNSSFIHKFIMSQLNSNWFVNFGVADVVKWALMSL